MKAVAFTSFGQPEVLRIMELDEPQAGPTEVRIRVKTAGVMPYDCGVRNGEIPLRKTITFPVIPGNEFAGIIDQIGERIDGFAIGDEVLGFSLLNSYAEYVVVSSDQIVKKPQNMPWEVAGGFSGNGQGAHMALKELDIKHGDTVLIHAAAGGLGTFAVQLAKAWGAGTIIGTASGANHDYLRSLGAIPVTYGEGLVERLRTLSPGGIDVALDGAGPEALRASIEVVKDRSRIRTMLADDVARELGIPLLSVNRSNKRLSELVDLYATGNIQIHFRKILPLDFAAEAHRLVGSGHGRGKVVLTVNS